MSPDPKNNRKSLSQLLREYNPEPGEQFHQRMGKAPWKQKETTMQPRTTRFGWQFAIALVIVLAVLAAVSVPSVSRFFERLAGAQGRAFQPDARCACKHARKHRTSRDCHAAGFSSAASHCPSLRLHSRCSQCECQPTPANQPALW